MELADHVQRAVQEVAKVIRKVGVDARNESVAREIAILSEVDLAQQEVADGVSAELVNELHGIDDVALRLRHLVAVYDQPAVAVDHLRQRQIERHEDARPDDRMEAHDLLADEVDVGRPILLKFLGIVQETDRRQVIRQGVEPDVDDMIGCDRHRDAPVERRARDAKIFKPLLDKIDHLVAPRDGLYEVGMFLDVREDTVGIVRHLEEVGVFLDLRHLAPTVGALAVYELALRPIALARRAVKPLVLALVDVALLVDAAEDLLHDALVALLGRADKIVVRDVELLPKPLKSRNDLVDVGKGRHALLLCLLLDLLPVLIASREKEHIVIGQPLEARDSVGDRRAVRVPDMQLRARVVDRRRYVE